MMDGVSAVYAGNNRQLRHDMYKKSDLIDTF